MGIRHFNRILLPTDENREDIACFLVQSGCSVNALRQEGFGGKGACMAKDIQTPLHMCCSWGLLDTARELIRFGAKINAKVSKEVSSLFRFLPLCS